MPVTITRPPAPRGTESRPPIDPRIRERRIAVRRAEGRRRLRFLCVVLAAVVLGSAAIGVTRSSLLAVHRVDVSGIAHVSRGDVLAAAGLDRRALMVDVHPGQVSRRLDALPWVAAATVGRHWPTTVRIRVTERTPVATIPAGNGQLAVVDATDRVLTVGPAPTGPGGPVPGLLPVIQGLAPAGPPGSAAGDAPALAALALVAAVDRGFPTALAAQVTTVTIADGQLSAAISPSVTVRLGPPDQLDAKLLALRALLERVDLKGGAVIDVRVPDAPVLTRPDKPSTVSTIPRG